MSAEMFENKYVKVLKPYPLVSHSAWDQIDDKEVLKLDWNELTVAPSPLVEQEILSFIKKGRLNWYPDVNNKKLLMQLSKYTSLSVENIQYFGSSDSLHEYIIKAFTEPSERALIVSPTYDNFRAVVESNGVLTQSYYLTEKFEMDYQHFSDSISLYSPKLVYICNPNNPTGTQHSLSELEELISRHQDVLFVVDEAYFEFTGLSVQDLVIKHDNIVISRTFSKAFGLASFRIGYAISSQSNISTLTKIRNPKNINAFSQVAANAALEDLEYMKKIVGEIQLAKEYFSNQLDCLGMNCISGGGNYVLLKMPEPEKEKFIAYLQARKIFIRNYSHLLGMSDYVRITIGTLEQMKKVVSVIKRFMNA